MNTAVFEPQSGDHLSTFLRPSLTLITSLTQTLTAPLFYSLRYHWELP